MISYNFLYETTSIVPNNDIEILETKSIPNSKSPKIVFEAQLQDSNRKNQNGRYYETSICQEIVDVLKPKATARALLQEVDHPIVDPNDSTGRKRAITISVKNSGTLIRDLHMSNGNVVGEMETLSGFLGPDVAHLLMDDKVDIGFSLRMFGKLIHENNMVRVAKPIRPITYDIVTNPSHDASRVLQFLPENINTFVSESNTSNLQLLEEISLDDIDLSDPNENIYDYLDQIINESFRKMSKVSFIL
jgi:hypothetical protein